MIEKIDINHFGCFSGFSWSTEVRDQGNTVAKFKKLNIIYGRNYSGKTTLSRIVRAMETGKISSRYNNPTFTATLSTGTVNNNQIPAQGHEIRVYNKDFVDEHLSFLRDDDGHITPFAVLGSENTEIEAEIEKLEAQLGKPENQTGLRYTYQEKKKDYNQKNQAALSAKEDIEKKLIDKANKRPTGIKHNTLYKDPNYDVRKLKIDILSIRESSFTPLQEDDRSAKVALLGEQPLPDITKKLSFSPSLASLSLQAVALTTKKIAPSSAIQELLNDALLQSWVKTGISYHKNKRSTCAFCGSPLPDELWKKLGDHFNQESQDLEKDIASALSKISTERQAIKQIVTIDKKSFYSTHQATFDAHKGDLEKEIATYDSALESLESELNARKSDIFSEREPINITDNSPILINYITNLNNLITKNNNATASLSANQNTARDDLRLSEIASFIADIDLDGEEQKAKDLEKKATDAKQEMDNVEADGTKINKRIDELKAQLRDERRGAERVNYYLGHFLGHGGLRLLAIEEASATTYRFKVMRGDQDAYNLSEGECSLVAFCYFLAKLDDVNTSGKKLIIYIDDPISSLDSNHIFFVFSLIENYLAKPLEDENGKILQDANKKNLYRYEQMFISTHNLEFLKYLKRLSKPSKDNESFLIVKKPSSSAINLMPDYLRNYVTELNYLFGEIYCCSSVANSNAHYHSFYNFGNNLRKFLEAFLFFKYPFFNSEKSDYDRRIKLFFGDGTNSSAFIQRLMNEFSHLGEFIDRGAQPIDCAEIETVATFVLRKIKENDKDQFEHFLQSIDKPDPFAA
ncbi:hypothetical protein WI77_08930 [Burkholderia ubonensis]|uniref:AAA family ATPase n=1 Tax=Burkholderia ubonensis TaxID=101571 RepID=UPI00075A04C9|nr:AAA family ATPase [Burkholderia ubonensis]KVC97224.1 hypothetical protein WI77_08930 [Burkholderia ubonensis]